MKEHLSASVEAGTVERLQELSGGQRKVGEFLSQVTQWLWEHKDELEAKPLSDYTLTEAHVSVPRAVMEEYERRLGKVEHHYTLVADTGTFTLTGTDASLEVGAALEDLERRIGHIEGRLNITLEPATVSATGVLGELPEVEKITADAAE